ncbi:hypothetical protein [Desmospora profundinema]|uniref:Uncharacterized protein n=1 Tax=Desmospora profundinema TaxID=1571184 RepID=A0ABU1IMN6_9BACL|nr:hypothetical protein [Desmospora profundinema]MDR6225224.1 hypothetical protein [Desmospora profundinema]
MPQKGDRSVEKPIGAKPLPEASPFDEKSEKEKMERTNRHNLADRKP